MKTYKKTISICLRILAALIIWEVAAYVLKDILNDPLNVIDMNKEGAALL